jgi:prefoldin subunit 5
LVYLKSSTGLKVLAQRKREEILMPVDPRLFVEARMEGNQELGEVLMLVDPRLFVEARMEEARRLG